MSVREWLPSKEVTSPRGAWTILANKRKGRPDRASFAQNTRVSPGVVGSRPGTDPIAPATGEVKGIFNWVAPNGNNYVLYRDGSVIRALLQPETLLSVLKPIGTMYRPSFSDLLVWIYFCGYDTTGVGVTQVRLFDGTNVDKAFRAAITTTAFTAADSGVGQSTQGTHFFGFVYQNRTGFSTQPVTADSMGNPFSVTLNAGNRQVTITVTIPPQLDGGTNPTGAQATLFLVATRADSAANWFFVPSAVAPSTTVNQQPVPYNTATTLTFIFDLSDEALNQGDPANNQFLLLTQDSMGNGPITPQFLVAYGTRMCYAVGSTLYVSDQANPQSLTADQNIVVMPNQRYLGAAFPLPGGTSLYIMGDHWTSYVTDNSDVPATWSEPISVSGQLGAPFQCCVCFKTGGNYGWVVTQGGPYLFNGAYDEKPLSYLVQDQWKRVNWKAAYAIEIADDTAALKLYIAVPLDGATEPTHVFVFDYQNGQEFDSIDFSIDNYNKATFGSIGVVKEVETDENNLWIGPTGGNQPVYPLVITVTDADGNQIQIQCVLDVACPFLS